MIATFAASDAGKVYGRTCQRFGVDPAAGLDDDVMAYNLRVALLVSDVEPDDDEPGESEFVRSQRIAAEAFA